MISARRKLASPGEECALEESPYAWSRGARRGNAVEIHQVLARVPSFFGLGSYIDHSILTYALEHRVGSQDPHLQRLALFSLFYGDGICESARLLDYLKTGYTPEEGVMGKRIAGALDDYLEMKHALWDEFIERGYVKSVQDELARDIMEAVGDVDGSDAVPKMEPTHFHGDAFAPPRVLAAERVAVVLERTLSQLFSFILGDVEKDPEWADRRGTLESIQGNFTEEEWRRLHGFAGSLDTEEGLRTVFPILHAMGENYASLSWERLLSFVDLAGEYNVEWALAAFEWDGEEFELGD